MITVNKDYISMLMLAEAYSEKHEAEEKINLFKKNYQKNLSDFERQVFENQENYKHYDDYMEWKAYENYLKDIETKIVELKSGNFQVA